MEKSRRAALKKLGLLSLAGVASQVVTLSDASLNPAAAKKAATKKNPGKGKGKSKNKGKGKGKGKNKK